MGVGEQGERRQFSTSSEVVQAEGQGPYLKAQL